MADRPLTSRALKLAGVALLAALVALQLVPYGREHTNPPVVMEPEWNRASTRDLAARACFDCHSNETRWPWYGSVAPASWFMQRHVDEGRAVLNFSEWQRHQREAYESAEIILEGKMPLGGYTLMHSPARLSPGEKRALSRGLSASVGFTAGIQDDD
jgi:hypothetical protein